MSDALVEKVAQVICSADLEQPHDWPDFYAYARAAIAVVLEEAAKVIETECHDDMTRAEEAAAIRAMINRGEN